MKARRYFYAVIWLVLLFTAGFSMRIGTNFWFIYPNGEQPFRDGVTFATTDNPWDPVYLERLAPYDHFRFMDWGGTNWSPLRNWSDRVKKSSQIQDGGWKQPGIAYEWMIDLCNRMQKDMWFCFPHLTIETWQDGSTNSFFHEMARLVKEQLDPNLKIYVEYSNETWNTQFSQTQYCVSQGQAKGLPVYGKYPNPIAIGEVFHVYAAVRIYKAFEDVFGDEMDARVVKVLAGWTGQEQWGESSTNRVMVEALKEPKVNPYGIMPDAFATAPYVGHSITSTGPAAVQEFRSAMMSNMQSVAQDHELVTSNGMEFIAYEGGQHVIHNAQYFSADPAIYDLYTEYFDLMARLFSVFSHYAHSGNWGDAGAWGSMTSKTQPMSEAHKYRAICDWIAAHSTGVFSPQRGAQDVARGQLHGSTGLVISSAINPQSTVFDIQGRLVKSKQSTTILHSNGAPGARLWSVK